MAPSLVVLKESGITIEDDEEEHQPFPPAIEDLRQTLLNFQEIIPLDEKTKLRDLCRTDNRKQDRDEQPKSEIYCDCRRKSYYSRWDAALLLRDRARHVQDREREDSWVHMMRNFVFENINDQASKEGDFIRDFLVWSSELTFTNAVPIRGQLSDGQDHQPRPDSWAGLGLYDLDHIRRLKGLELNDKGIQYFRGESLECQARYRLRDRRGRITWKKLQYLPNSTKQLAAFPWLIVEYKRDGTKTYEKIADQRTASSQVANASYTSLRLSEELSRPAKLDVPPVIAFTSVGPRVKIFLTYKSRINGKYRMSCIWTGNIEHILDAFKLRRIIDQAICWALRFFKPWVIECLDRWYELNRAKKPEEETDDESDEETEDGSEGSTDAESQEEECEDSD